MPVQKVSVLVPPLRIVPPGAALLARATEWLFASADSRSPSLSGWVAGVQRRRSQERAARRVARDRDALFSLASRYASTQPEFAKDLIAAARNERSA